MWAYEAYIVPAHFLLLMLRHFLSCFCDSDFLYAHDFMINSLRITSYKHYELCSRFFLALVNSACFLFLSIHRNSFSVPGLYFLSLKFKNVSFSQFKIKFAVFKLQAYHISLNFSYYQNRLTFLKVIFPP